MAEPLADGVALAPESSRRPAPCMIWASQLPIADSGPIGKVLPIGMAASLTDKLESVGMVGASGKAGRQVCRAAAGIEGARAWQDGLSC